MRVARLGLRRIATALGAVGALLLVAAPLLPLAEGVPVGGLRNSLFWRTPLVISIVFVFAAAAVPCALALRDSSTRGRILGPVLLIVSGIGTTLLALSLAASDLLDRCNWGYAYAGLTTGFMRPCVGLAGRYEEAQGLGTAMAGGTLLLVAGLVLPFTTKFDAAESERRRRRVRSLSYIS